MNKRIFLLIERIALKTIVLYGLMLCILMPDLAQAIDLDAIAGVYRHRFANGDVSGEKYTSENILEIVKVSPESAYFRTHLDFFNGHQCALWGLADKEGEDLVYRQQSDGQKCELHLSVRNDAIILADKGNQCRNTTCGSRGSYNGASFALKNRRVIRYMKRLQASEAFKSTVKEHGTATPQ